MCLIVILSHIQGAMVMGRWNREETQERESSTLSEKVSLVRVMTSAPNRAANMWIGGGIDSEQPDPWARAEHGHSDNVGRTARWTRGCPSRILLGRVSRGLRGAARLRSSGRTLRRSDRELRQWRGSRGSSSGRRWRGARDGAAH